MFWTLKLSRPLLVFLTVIGLSGAVFGSVSRDEPQIHLTSAEGTGLIPMQTVSFAVNASLVGGHIGVNPPTLGVTVVGRNKLWFKPRTPLHPGERYAFTVHAVTQANEVVTQEFLLDVRDVSQTLWVYVDLGSRPQLVKVFRGSQLEKEMRTSGGKPGDETPAGTFRIQNRGHHFWSQKYEEGAYYWVRIFGNYLFHSVPVDIKGNIIEEEAKKLGCPASHGCLRLSMPDAVWFYNSVPDGTLVHIDRAW